MLRILITYFLVSLGFANSRALITSFETAASLSVAFSALSRASLLSKQKKLTLTVNSKHCVRENTVDITNMCVCCTCRWVGRTVGGWDKRSRVGGGGYCTSQEALASRKVTLKQYKLMSRDFPKQNAILSDSTSI